MKRYWLFYGWYDDYDCPGSNGGLSDFYGSFDSIEGAYVDFAMAKNYCNEPACWCQILDSETNEIVKLQGYGETDRVSPRLRKHFKCPEIETRNTDHVGEWIDAEIHQAAIRAQKDDIPGEWVKTDNFALNFAPPYKPIPLFARSKFIPANGQKPVRSKFNLKDFIVDFFNKHL